MECNKDDAVRAKKISERKLSEKDISGAKKFALKAQNLYPDLDGITQLISTLDVFTSAEKKINGEIDWYGVLGVDPKADDDTIRKQYRKLALTVHPDKNKLAGSDGAFKILSEAWSMLSDKSKRVAYDQKRNSRSSYQKIQVPSRNVPETSSRNHVNPSARPASSKPTTFWTVCDRCKMQYEYLINYLNHTLLCPNCHEPFLAKYTPAPPINGRKPSTPWSQYHQNSKSGILGNNQANHVNRQTGSNLSSSQAARMQQTRSDNLKRSHESENTDGTGQTKKMHVVENTAHLGNRDLANQMAQKRSSEPDINVSSSLRSITTRDPSQTDIRKMLIDRAKLEIQKKLNEWHIAKRKGEVAFNGVKNHKPVGSDVNKVQETFHPPKFGEELDSQKLDLAMAVPDPDFHDFDSDRTEKSFCGNQVWAAYDDDDGMPRFYAMIHEVVSLRPFKMRISWLNSKSNSELAPINWIGSGFPKTSGDFWIGKRELNNKLNSFSHKVKFVKGTRGVIHIYPSKGDVWAVYRNWSADWNEFTPDDVIHKYDMVEVLEDYDGDLGVNVMPLIKVVGFKTVFQKRSDAAADKAWKIPREELFRFSHQVPSYLLTGCEARDAPKGCWEIDPAASPLELLQVITEKNVEISKKLKNLSKYGSDETIEEGNEVKNEIST